MKKGYRPKITGVKASRFSKAVYQVDLTVPDDGVFPVIRESPRHSVLAFLTVWWLKCNCPSDESFLCVTAWLENTTTELPPVSPALACGYQFSSPAPQKKAFYHKTSIKAAEPDAVPLNRLGDEVSVPTWSTQQAAQ